MFSPQWQPLPPPQTIISAAASALLSSYKSDLQNYLSYSMKTLFHHHLSTQLTIIIPDSNGLTSNHLFQAADLYLSTTLPPSTHRIKLTKPKYQHHFTISLDHNQSVTQVFQTIKCNWVLHSERIQSSYNSQEIKSFELSFHKKHKDTILNTYLPHVLKTAQEIEEHNQKLKLHTVSHYSWDSVVLNHPATFETLAMDDDKKDLILEDLKLFVRRKDYYKRVGRAWKRGYLLYGPPGTGKSSFIAAMANYLKFDVYDLDLKEVRDNSVLRTLLIRTKNRSIVVIEDIDCNVGLHRREAKNKGVDIDKITLSGLLNLIDGLWSSCGDERIIIFTTNHKEVLDPALLRPGRMDVHVEMSYCTYDGFKTLASTYLQVEEDEKLSTFQAVKKVLKKTKVTPAEIAGELMKGEDVDVVLENLIQWLRMKHETK